MAKMLLNFLFKLSNKNNKNKKNIKLIITITSVKVRNLSYIIDQFISISF